jgi:hypothetical protein
MKASFPRVSTTRATASSKGSSSHTTTSGPAQGSRPTSRLVFDDGSTHTALVQRVRRHVAVKRILHLVKAFLKAGVLSEEGVNRDTITGRPRREILSPLLANIALSVLLALIHRF